MVIKKKPTKSSGNVLPIILWIGVVIYAILAYLDYDIFGYKLLSFSMQAWVSQDSLVISKVVAVLVGFMEALMLAVLTPIVFIGEHIEISSIALDSLVVVGLALLISVLLARDSQLIFSAPLLEKIKKYSDKTEGVSRGEVRMLHWHLGSLSRSWESRHDLESMLICRHLLLMLRAFRLGSPSEGDRRVLKRDDCILNMTRSFLVILTNHPGWELDEAEINFVLYGTLASVSDYLNHIELLEG